MDRIRRSTFIISNAKARASKMPLSITSIVETSKDTASTSHIPQQDHPVIILYCLLQPIPFFVGNSNKYKRKSNVYIMDCIMCLSVCSVLCGVCVLFLTTVRGPRDDAGYVRCGEGVEWSEKWANWEPFAHVYRHGIEIDDDATSWQILSVFRMWDCFVHALRQWVSVWKIGIQTMITLVGTFLFCISNNHIRRRRWDDDEKQTEMLVYYVCIFWVGLGVYAEHMRI